MTAALLALLLAQTAPTLQQHLGALNTLSAAWDDRANRTITRNAARTRICVGPAGGVLPAGTVVVRYGVAMLSRQAQTALGRQTVVGDLPAMIEIQAVAADEGDYRPMVRRNIELFRDESEIREAPLNAACEVGIVTFDDASPSGVFRCACSTGSACKAADGTTAATQGITLGPTEFTASAACRPKPCMVRGDLDDLGQWVDRSWPAACPKP